MNFPAVVFAIAALLWWSCYARRASPLTLVVGFIAVAYVLGPPFWSAKAGPLTWNVERVALAALLAACCIRLRNGGLTLRPLVPDDWPLILFVGYLTLRCALTDAPIPAREGNGPWWRLISSFWIPSFLYLVARSAVLNETSWRKMLVVWTLLGGFLGATAIAEVSQQWWAVFPRYIADPGLGTHFGRARGPVLMSASLGVYLTISFWAAWMLGSRASSLLRSSIVVVLGIAAAGVYFTYTRSTWIGLAAGAAVVPLLQVDKRWRPALLAAMLLLGSTGAIAVASKVAALGRGDDASAEHSVFQRASFTYVSLRMFRDAPLFGHGFGRFYDKKMPYLADRNQQIELESIRGLDHHITPLSILVETGLVGLILYLALLGAWWRSGRRLIVQAEPGSWERGQGLFAVGAWIAYVASALFHDLSLSPSEHWALFATTGASVGIAAERRRAWQAAQRGATHAEAWRGAAVGAAIDESPGAPREHRLGVPARRHEGAASPSGAGRVALFGLELDPFTMEQAVGSILKWCTSPRQERCRFVVTPNVDHAVMWQSQPSLRKAYANASLVLADGAPIVWASRLLRRPIPERVAGSDLAPALFDAASVQFSGTDRLLRVFLLGAAPGVAERAAQQIVNRWCGVEVVGTWSPPLGFEHDAAENERILAAVAAASPDLVLIGLGAPKQELWVNAYATQLQAKAALCIGATIDFLAGEKRRAPVWMQQNGLEWLHRLATEPRRLAKRYLYDAWVFPQLVWRELR